MPDWPLSSTVQRLGARQHHIAVASRSQEQQKKRPTHRIILTHCPHLDSRLFADSVMLCRPRLRQSLPSSRRHSDGVEPPDWPAPDVIASR